MVSLIGSKMIVAPSTVNCSKGEEGSREAAKEERGAAAPLAPRGALRPPAAAAAWPQSPS